MTRIRIGYVLFSVITLVYVRYFAWYLVISRKVVLVVCRRKIKNSWLNPFLLSKFKITLCRCIGCMTLFSNFQSKICILKDFKYSNFRLYWNVIPDQSEKHTIFYKIVLLIIWHFDVHFAIQGLKMAKTKQLSRDMRDRIIERHKGGQGYRKISKEMNLVLSTVENIIRK